MRNRLTRVRLGHRPHLETLEDRLPPGDTLLGVLIGMAALPCDIDPLNATDQAKASPAPVDEMTKTAVVSRPTRPVTEVESSIAASRLGSFSASNAATAITEGWNAFAAPDAVLPRATSQAATAWHPAMAVGASLSGLTPAAQGASNGAGGIRGSAVAPSLALRAGVQNSPPREQVPTTGVQSRAADVYGKLALSFEANQGQTDSRVDFMARMGSGTVFLTPTTAVFSITQPESVDVSVRRELVEHGGLTPRRSPETNGVALHMQFVGANPSATPAGQERQPGIVNYFIGNDPSQWHANIPTFGRVVYDDVYPGIDLAYYGNNGQLEYDFIVSPGADPNQITLEFADADAAEIDPQGDLVLHTAAGDIVQQKPYTYQESSHTRQEVASRYVVDGTQVRFAVAAYDPMRPLVIDPLVLGYSTFLGGSSGDGANDIAVDGVGYAYLIGYTQSSNFPVTPGAFDTTFNGGIDFDTDAFVTKLNRTGSGLVYSTFLGGFYDDFGSGIAVDEAGSAYLTGVTYGPSFPITPGAFDATCGCGPSVSDAFVTKLRADGAGLLYSTFLGGFSNDTSHDIAVDVTGSAYVTGYTGSGDFPTTPGAFDNTPYGDAFVTKVNASGTALAYSTVLGGNSSDEGYGIAVDSSGNAYVTGHAYSLDFPTTPGAFDTTHSGGGFKDVFVTKLNPAGTTLAYSTFLGESSDEWSYGIAVDGSGNAYVTGRTFSIDFPTTPGAFDTSYNNFGEAFVTKVNAFGTALAYSTFLGGSAQDWGTAIALDTGGNAYVVGRTDSANFPTTADAFDTTFNGGGIDFDLDAFVTKLRADGTGLIYSTFLGGHGGEFEPGIAAGGSGSAFVTGFTGSSNFPTTAGAFDTSYSGGGDAYVTKFCERACRVPAVATQVVP